MMSMFVARKERPKRAVYVRGTVACQGCRQPIHIYRLAALAEEFSVRCPACGTRGFHARRMVSVEQLPERRRKPRA
jgi:ribosomal protein S27E